MLGAKGLQAPLTPIFHTSPPLAVGVDWPLSSSWGNFHEKMEIWLRGNAGQNPGPCLQSFRLVLSGDQSSSQNNALKLGCLISSLLRVPFGFVVLPIPDPSPSAIVGLLIT